MAALEVQGAEMTSMWIHAQISEAKTTKNNLKTASTAKIIEIEMAVAIMHLLITMITEI